jgi:hypothetical protein
MYTYTYMHIYICVCVCVCVLADTRPNKHEATLTTDDLNEMKGRKVRRADASKLQIAVNERAEAQALQLGGCRNDAAGAVALA